MDKWLDQYDDGGPIDPNKVLTWNEYLDYMNATEPWIRNFDPSAVLYKPGESDSSGNFYEWRYEPESGEGRFLTHNDPKVTDFNNQYQAVLEQKLNSLVDGYNDLYSYDYNKKQYTGLHSPENIERVYDTRDVQKILDDLKAKNALSGDDYVRSKINDQVSKGAINSGILKNKVISEYTRIAPQNKNLVNNLTGENYFEKEDTDKKYAIDSTFTLEPKEGAMDKSLAKYLSFEGRQYYPAPNYNYNNVKRRFDEKGQEVMSREDFPGGRIEDNTYYDFPGSTTENIYNEKVRLNQMSEKDMAALNKKYPFLTKDSFDYQEQEDSRAAEIWANDPYAYYRPSDKTFHSYFCPGCQKTSGATYTEDQDNGFGYLNYKPWDYTDPGQLDILLKTKGKLPLGSTYVGPVKQLTNKAGEENNQEEVGFLYDVWSDPDPRTGVRRKKRSVYYYTPEESSWDDVYPLNRNFTEEEANKMEADRIKPYLPEEYLKSQEKPVIQSPGKLLIQPPEFNPQIHMPRRAELPVYKKVPDFKKGGWLDRFDDGGSPCPDGYEWDPKLKDCVKLYTDRDEFKKANQAYQDSLDVYNAPQTSYARSQRIHNLINSGNLQASQTLLAQTYPYYDAYRRLTILNNQPPQPVSGSAWLLGLNPNNPNVAKYKKPTQPVKLVEEPTHMIGKKVTRIPTPERQVNMQPSNLVNLSDIPDRLLSWDQIKTKYAELGDIEPVYELDPRHRKGQRVKGIRYRKVDKDNPRITYPAEILFENKLGGAAKWLDNYNPGGPIIPILPQKNKKGGQKSAAVQYYDYIRYK